MSGDVQAGGRGGIMNIRSADRIEEEELQTLRVDVHVAGDAREHDLGIFEAAVVRIGEELGRREDDAGVARRVLAELFQQPVEAGVKPLLLIGIDGAGGGGFPEGVSHEQYPLAWSVVSSRRSETCWCCGPRVLCL